MVYINPDHWTPKLKLWINGYQLGGWTDSYTPGTYAITDGLAIITSLNIRGGRADVTVQPEPMQMSIDIVKKGGLADSIIPIGSSIVVEIYDDVATAWEPLFTGVMSDKTVSTQDWHDADGLYNYSIKGISRMASLSMHRQTWTTSTSNAITASGFTCSQRIVEVLSNWQYSSSWVGTINSDSIYIHKRAAGQYVDYDLIESAAQTGRGCFHDRRDGKVYYNNYANTLPATYAALPPDLILADGLQSTRSVTDIYNAIHITTTDASLSDSTASSSGSQSSYGYRYASRDTECDVKTDMNTQAADFLSARANPRWRPSALRLDLGQIGAPDAQLSQLIQTRTNSRWLLPFPVGLGGDLDCLVDNWAWSFDRNRMYLDLQMSLVTDTHPG